MNSDPEHMLVQQAAAHRRRAYACLLALVLIAMALIALFNAERVSVFGSLVKSLEVPLPEAAEASAPAASVPPLTQAQLQEMERVMGELMDRYEPIASHMKELKEVLSHALLVEAVSNGLIRLGTIAIALYLMRVLARLASRELALADRCTGVMLALRLSSEQEHRLSELFTHLYGRDTSEGAPPPAARAAQAPAAAS